MIDRPRRIISLVPSLTELLSDLGLDEHLVGLTKFCIHPDHLFRSLPRVGGTKKVNLDTIHDLAPDLIIANKEENTRVDVEELMKHFPVHLTDVTDLDSALKMISTLGELTGTEERAGGLTFEIEREFTLIDKLTEAYTALYLIWKDPYMSVGHDTFIHDMLRRCGFINVCSDETRYPTIEMDRIEPPQCVLLSSEPFPFKESHIDSIKAKWPDTKVVLVDGEYFSWYGSRLSGAPAYFNSLLSMLGEQFSDGLSP